MDPQRWTDVDRFWTDRLLDPDPALDAALAANAEGGLPPIDVSPALGRFLHLLARSTGARRVLEIGTLGGYSTIQLARAVQPGGVVITCEREAHHAAVARANLERAGLTDTVDIRVGPALDTLPGLTGPFDLVFVDADKPANTEYLDHAVRLTRAGGVIVIDNVVREGRILDADDTDPAIVGTRRFADALAADDRVDATVLQMVGEKGYDGFVLAVVRG